MAQALVFNQRAVKACDSVKMFGATSKKQFLDGKESMYFVTFVCR